MKHFRSIVKVLCSALLMFVIFSSGVAEVSAEASKLLRQAQDKPNIVFIFIDDMGYGDIGPYGSTKNKTPALDRMATEGMKFTDFYVSSVNCTPSRAALLTGCYADRIGMDFPPEWPVVFPGDAEGLNPSEITLAEMLKAEGYATGCFGKWHLGDQPQFMPLNHGFDEYEGIPYSNDMWPLNKGKRTGGKGWPPLPYLKQDEVVAEVSDGASQALLCEAATNATIDFIKRHRNEPFFAYVPHAFVHGPRYVSKKQAERAEGDITRGHVEAVDESVGQILSTLNELGLAENTLVFFVSDNGPAKGLSAGPLRGQKGGFKYEGHMRVPMLAWWPGKISAGTVCYEIGTSIDFFPTLAKLTGGEVPTDRIIDGKDITTLLTTKGAKSPHSVLYYEYEGVRKGNWKLVRVENRFELYNLENDLGEKSDISKQYPEKLKELRELLLAHEQRVKGALRPVGRVANSEPILKYAGNLPSLAKYMNKAELQAIGD